MTQVSGLYRFEGLSPLVSIDDDGTLRETLVAIMQGWAVVPAERRVSEPEPEPAIKVRNVGDGWAFLDAAGSVEAIFDDPVATACKVIADLYKAQTIIDREGFCFHAAGVRIGGGLILLTGPYHAGKSVVTAACAAAGMQVFSDDIIPLALGGWLARAPGLAMRLRLPLPETLAPATRAFVDRHRVAAGRRYIYIRPPREHLAANREEAPVRAIVSLSRAEARGAALARLPLGDALVEAIRRNFAREAPATTILDNFDRMVAKVPAFRLAYGRAEDAAALLRDAFAHGLPASAAVEAIAPPQISPRPDRRNRRMPASSTIRRRAGARVRERDGQAFLTDANDSLIFHLNATGAAVWRALEQPILFGELVDIFVAAFPDRAADDLAADLSRVIRGLARNRLVRVVTDTNNQPDERSGLGQNRSSERSV